MEYGDYSVTAAEITEFAEKYDPQPFHVDEQAAEASMFGGLIASGWHTTAIWMRMTVDSLFSEWVALGSPGVDNIRWRRPTRPGQTLSAHTTVVDKSVETDSRGLVDVDTEVRTGEGEVLMTMTAHVMVKRKQT